jgi:hypothetical protein
MVGHVLANEKGLDLGIESADCLKMRKSQSEFVTMATTKPQKISKRLEECIILKANFCIIDPSFENVAATVPTQLESIAEECITQLCFSA